MKRFINYFVLCVCFCIFLPIRIQAQSSNNDKVILKFKKGYNHSISLKDFIYELNSIPYKYNFKDSLFKELTNKELSTNKVIETTNDDSKIFLRLSPTNNIVDTITINTLTYLLIQKNNETFREKLKLRLSKFSRDESKSLKSLILQISQTEIFGLPFLIYLGLIVFFLLLIATLLGWYIKGKSILSEINYRRDRKKFRLREVVDFWKNNFEKIEEENGNMRNSTPENNAIDQIEFKKTREALETCKEKCAELEDENKKLQLVHRKNDNVNDTYTSNTDTNNLNRNNVGTVNIETPDTEYRGKENPFYFSSCYKEGGFGIFEDENKSLDRQPDSLYRLEVSTEKPNEATFYFDPTSSDTKALLGYVAYTIEPVCNSTNPFQNNYTRITHISNGKAFLENGKWIVSGENKATIRYE